MSVTQFLIRVLNEVHWSVNKFCKTLAGNCGHPQNLIQSEGVGVFVVTGYINKSAPVMAGTTVNYSCSSGLVHSGASYSICTENGDWEPSPTEVECKG